MQPLRLTIFGDFWDSYLYRGRLYLWDMSNDIHVYDWNRFIEDLNANDGLALTCAFMRGDALYRQHSLEMVFRDPKIREVIAARFSQSADSPIERSLRDLAPYRLSSQENPSGDLPSDLTIYGSVLYQVTARGIIDSTVHRRGLRRGVSTRVRKRSDLRGVSIEAAHRTLAIAAGSDGFYELTVDASEARRLGARHSTIVRWMYASIFASSDADGGTLAAFSWKDEPARTSEGHKWRRSFRELVSADEIGAMMNIEPTAIHFSWGVRDKIYLLTDAGIHVVSFQQDSSDRATRSPAFEKMGVAASPTTERPIDASAAAFGVILEYRDGVKAVLSDDTVYSFAEPVVRWRVFPRSVWYENQLHLVCEDRIVIESFNHDYKVDQDRKLLGSKVKANDIYRRDA